MLVDGVDSFTSQEGGPTLEIGSRSTGALDQLGGSLLILMVDDDG